MSLRLMPKKGEPGGTGPMAGCEIEKPKPTCGKPKKSKCPGTCNSEPTVPTGPCGTKMAGPASGVTTKIVAKKAEDIEETHVLSAGLVPTRYKLRCTHSDGEIERKVAGYVRKNLSQPKFARELKNKLDDAYKLTRSRDSDAVKPSLSTLQAKLVETIHKLSSAGSGQLNKKRATHKGIKLNRYIN